MIGLSPVLVIADDAVRANSRDVAASFDKEHRDVLRAIDNLIRQEPDLTLRNFAQGTYLNPRGEKQEHRCFVMDRDGFALLAMGFTGPKALKWKLAYIDAFNLMEAELRDRPVPGRHDTDCEAAPLPDETERLRLQLHMVREARIAFGTRGARRAWAIAGLPDLGLNEAGPIVSNAVALVGKLHKSVADWIDERTEAQAGNRVRTMALYHDYLDWAKREGVSANDIVSLTAFGKSLTNLGLGSMRADVTYRIGLRLRE